ncbi:MAG TPA: hypothetical protein VLM79_07625 [Kofleriaceae bacterium]|nr:hypothetical protein [Kofleriaceae bacterium]
MTKQMSQPPLIARLLSRRRELSRIEKEQIFARVVAEVAPSRWRSRTAWLTASLGVAVAAGVLLMAWPSRPASDDAFTARGGNVQPAFRIHCIIAAQEAPCRSGAKLVFEVWPGAATYFAAFARRDDGAVIWYFPDQPTGVSKDLRSLVHGILDTGIIVGPEHQPGSYEITGVFSPQPIDRAAIRAIAGSPPTNLTSLVKRRMIIE